MIVGGKSEVISDEVSGDRGGLESDFVEIIFVFEDGEVGVEGFNLIKRPGVVEEISVTKSIFEAVGGKIRNVVVGDWIDMIIGNFARENVVFFELARNDFRVANDFAGIFLD